MCNRNNSACVTAIKMLDSVPLRFMRRRLYMKYIRFAFSLFLIPMFFSCQSQKKLGLEVNLNNEAHYESQDGEMFVAKFYSLSDNSLYFAKVQNEKGETLTLSRAISASGERYIDALERTEFWTKGDEAFFIIKNDDGTETRVALTAR